ncbi:MAG: hypothetical protein Q9183_005768, partial [Haloplaca sp. 2 TL-2023]
DEADALEREDGRANGEGESIGVEKLDSRMQTACRQGGDVVVPDVEESHEDEDICQQCRGAQARDVPNQRHGNEHSELNCDQCFGSNADRATWGDGVEERAKILGDEDDTRADKTNLGQRDGPQDQSSQLGTSDCRTKLTIATAMTHPAAQKKMERQSGKERDGDQGDGREEYATISESLWKEHDAGTDESFEQGEEGFGETGIPRLNGSSSALPPTEQGSGFGGLGFLVIVGRQLRFVIGFAKVFTSEAPIEGKEGNEVAGDGSGGGGEAIPLLNELTTEAAWGTLLTGWDKI